MTPKLRKWFNKASIEELIEWLGKDRIADGADDYSIEISNAGDYGYYVHYEDSNNLTANVEHTDLANAIRILVLYFLERKDK